MDKDDILKARFKDIKDIDQSEVKEKYYYLIDLIRKKIMIELEKEQPDINKLKQYKAMTDVLINLRKESYQLLGIPEVAKEYKQDISTDFETKLMQVRWE
jgi:hypothetical protein